MLQDLAAERLVLSGIYQHGEDAYLDVCDFLQTSTFTDRSNQAFYHCMEELFEKRGVKSMDQASMFSVASELGYTWLFDKEINHTRTLMSGSTKLDNVRMWASKLRKMEFANALKDVTLTAANNIDSISGHESIDHILGLVETPIFDFTSFLKGDGQKEPQPLGNGMIEHLTYLMDNPRENVGIPSPYPYYNEAIGGGYRRKTVSLMGARTGVGKSMISDNIALHVAKNLNIPVLYLDTEMSDEDHWYRTAANLSNVKKKRIETGKCGADQEERARVLKAAEDVKNMPFTYLNVSGMPFEEGVSIMRRWVAKKVGSDINGKTNDCLIIYDYIKLMQTSEISSTMQEYQILGLMMTTLHNFGVRNDVPIASFVQLNRDGIEIESTAAAAGSDRIVWLASNFAIFKDKSTEDLAEDGLENGDKKIVVVKARHGAATKRGDYINLQMDGDYARIVEKETRFNLEKRKNQTMEQNTQPPEMEDVDVPTQ